MATFVTKIKIIPTPEQELFLNKTLEVARFVYNKSLAHFANAYKNRYRNPEWKAVVKEKKLLEKEAVDDKNIKKTDAYKIRKENNKKETIRLSSELGYTQYLFSYYATGLTNSWMNKEYHLSSTLLSKVCERAQNTIEKCQTLPPATTNKRVMAKRIERRQKSRWSCLQQQPHFLRKGEYNTIESKIGGPINYNKEDNCIDWKLVSGRGNKPKKIHKFKIDPKSIDEVSAYGLNGKIKYVNICRKVRFGKYVYEAQLICDGQPFKKDKHKLGNGVVGLDLGTRFIAIYTEKQCYKIPLFDKKYLLDTTKLQRQIERQRIACNPQAYKGKSYIPGQPRRQKSRSMIKNQQRLTEIHRKSSEHRKNRHRQIANFVLHLGSVFYIEKTDKTEWQEGGFGKSSQGYAPGQFEAELTRIIEKNGGQIQKIDVYKTKLSQACLCGEYTKKSLSQRKHKCDKCEIDVDRDVFSAYLATFVNKTGKKLDISKARECWRNGACDTLSTVSNSIV